MEPEGEKTQANEESVATVISVCAFHRPDSLIQKYISVLSPTAAIILPSGDTLAWFIAAEQLIGVLMN